ncbi:hypothetical protein [Klebsiella aerogenes]|uniref:hypothetical protein n=1 Tax=Klebsiella aerogenes TaxID=548 RepID=UPI002FF82834
MLGSALTLPNLFWLMDHNFSAFKWVEGQIHTGINPHILTALLSVFYPVGVGIGLLRCHGVSLSWPVADSHRALYVVFLAPLAFIIAWFLFHDGGRLTEWLQPFVVVSLALLPGMVRRYAPGQGPGTFVNLYVTCAVLIWLGYILTMGLNIRNAGVKFSGIKLFSQQVGDEWKKLYGTPLYYTGGDWLSQWLTIYAPSRPRVMNPWRNDEMPGVYNREITRERLEHRGGIVVGKPGRRCPDENFTELRHDWPGVELRLKKQWYFTPDPGSTTVPVCVGFIPPGDELPGGR